MTSALRPPRDDDAPEVARLMSEHWPDPIDEQSVIRVWTSPSVDRERDARLEPECYAILEGLDDVRVWLDVRGIPSDALFDWAEARAAEKGRRVFVGAWSDNEALLAAYEQRGFRLVRHSLRMAIDLSESPPGPIWPEGIEMRAFHPGDERAFYETHQETFQDSWEPVEEKYEDWTHWLLQPPAFVPDLWFLARAGDDPAGFAICHPHPGNPELGWVRILGVRRSWRRRGLGRALLLHAFAEFRRRGLSRAGLGVDAESLTGAHKLYESAGMRVAARYDIYEKELA